MSLQYFTGNTHVVVSGMLACLDGLFCMEFGKAMTLDLRGSEACRNPYDFTSRNRLLEAISGCCALGCRNTTFATGEAHGNRHI